MQENKFRGISQYTGEMVYGQLLRGENDFNIVTNFSRAIDIELVPIKKGTQGQFTGVKDKNGNEIYGEDICNFGSFTEPPMVVKFSTEKVAWCLVCVETNEEYLISDFHYEQLVVLGNTFEHQGVYY